MMFLSTLTVSLLCSIGFFVGLCLANGWIVTASVVVYAVYISVVYRLPDRKAAAGEVDL
jgi:ABC-type transport system involved in multi-copper enzyme maturation permease subunit